MQVTYDERLFIYAMMLLGAAFLIALIADGLSGKNK